MSNPNQVITTLRDRRSVSQPRLGGSVIPDHQVVREALESARWAPNHKHTEPWRFYLLDDERIVRLAELNAELLERDGAKPEKVAAKLEQWRAVPGVVVFSVKSAADADETTRREDYAAVACAAQNFMLHLWSAGVASKWSTAAVWRHEEFWSLLGHDPAALAGEGPGEEVLGTFFYGLAADVPAGRRRLGLEEVLRDFRR
ncbi:MAG TPA: nitroreductase family protein [Trueperaceae bacterium]|nr:nitroreductase family protein [Trueperaceae bacterium]